MNYQLAPMSPGCKPQKTDLKEFAGLAGRDPAEIVAFFTSDIDAANRVLNQSYDKRYSPSTFVEEAEGGYRVGWYEGGRKHMRRFAGLPEAAADYLLFRLGAGAWRGRESII